MCGFDSSQVTKKYKNYIRSYTPAALETGTILHYTKGIRIPITVMLLQVIGIHIKKNTII